MQNSASSLLDAGATGQSRACDEVIAHLREVAARIQIDESRPDIVLQAMLNIEQYLRGVLPDLEEDPASDSPGRGPRLISC